MWLLQRVFLRLVLGVPGSKIVVMFLLMVEIERGTCKEDCVVCSNNEESQMSLLDAAPGHGAPLLQYQPRPKRQSRDVVLVVGEMARWRR